MIRENLRLKVTGVICTFFGEMHHAVSVKPTIHGDYADLEVVAALRTLWIAPPPSGSLSTPPMSGA